MHPDTFMQTHCSLRLVLGSGEGRRVLQSHQKLVQRTVELDMSLSVSWSLGYQHLSSRIARGSGAYHSYL